MTSIKKRYERNHFKAFSNSINKKKLYKKGKEWVIGSLTLLAMTGMGVAVDYTTHADTNAKPATTSVGSTADIENKATALYNHVVAKNITSNNANQLMKLGATQNSVNSEKTLNSSKTKASNSQKGLDTELTQQPSKSSSVSKNQSSNVPIHRGFGAERPLGITEREDTIKFIDTDNNNQQVGQTIVRTQTGAPNDDLIQNLSSAVNKGNLQNYLKINKLLSQDYNIDFKSGLYKTFKSNISNYVPQRFGRQHIIPIYPYGNYNLSIPVTNKASDYVQYTYNGKVIGKKTFSDNNKAVDPNFENLYTDVKANNGYNALYTANTPSDNVNYSDLQNNYGLPKGYALDKNGYSNLYNSLSNYISNLNQNDENNTDDYGNNHYTIPVVPNNADYIVYYDASKDDMYDGVPSTYDVIKRYAINGTDGNPDNTFNSIRQQLINNNKLSHDDNITKNTQLLWQNGLSSDYEYSRDYSAVPYTSSSKVISSGMISNDPKFNNTILYVPVTSKYNSIINILYYYHDKNGNRVAVPWNEIPKINNSNKADGYIVKPYTPRNPYHDTTYTNNGQQLTLYGYQLLSSSNHAFSNNQNKAMADYAPANLINRKLAPLDTTSYQEKTVNYDPSSKGSQDISFPEVSNQDDKQAYDIYLDYEPVSKITVYYVDQYGHELSGLNSFTTSGISGSSYHIPTYPNYFDNKYREVAINTSPMSQTNGTLPTSYGDNDQTIYVHYNADSITPISEDASVITTTHYYWNNGDHNVSSASTVNNYSYSRSATYDQNTSQFVSNYGSWSLNTSSNGSIVNNTSNDYHLIGSYGNLPDSSVIMNNLVPGKTASYTDYVIYAPDSVCDTHDYTSATDTVKYLVNGTSSAVSPASSSVRFYSRADVMNHTTNHASVSDWNTSDNFSQVNVPQTITSNGVTYHVVNANVALPTDNQVISSLNQAQPGNTTSASFTNNVYYAADSVINKPEVASAVETTNYYWNNGGQTVSSASTVSTYSYSRSASYDTNLNSYVGSFGSWSVTGSTHNAAQDTSLSGYQFASSFGILPSDNTIENNLKPGQTVSYVNNRIYGPDSVNSAQNYGIATDTVNYLINGTSSAVSSASSSVQFYSQSDVDNHTTSANSLGNWRTNGSFSIINAPQTITSNGVTYHQVSADLTLPSDAQVIGSLNQTRSGNSASASFTNNVYYAPDTVSAKPESASATTTTYYYWDNGPNNVSSASTVSTYNYGRSASYDARLNSYVGPFTNWSLTNSSVNTAANSGANGDRLVGSYGSVPDQATIMNGLMAGRNTSYANYVIYAQDSVCDTHDYTSATDTVKYLVNGTSSAVSPASSSVLFYSRADVMDHTTNHASVSDWKTNGNFSNVNVPQIIFSGGVTYSAVSANSQLPSVVQGSLTAKTANYENDVYYAPVTAKLTVNYVDTTNGNVVKSADAGTMNNGSQWTVSQNYLNQVPNNYTLDNNYDNNANAQLLKTPITVTANGSSTANVYVKPVQTQQPSGPITVHYVTSDSQPVQVNGKAVSDVKFTGQPLNDAQLETPINGYNPVGVMGNLSYTSYPQDVYVVYKPTQNVTRGHIHVRFVDDSNHQREFWSDKFSDKTGAAFDLREDNYANRYLPGYHFDNNVTGNTSAYGNDSANDPHVIVVGYAKVSSDDQIAIPQSAEATEVVNYLADKNGDLSPLTSSTSQSVAFSGNGTVNTKTRQFSSATNWSTDQHFSSASEYSSAGWSLFSSVNDVPASVAPGGHYVEDLYYKPVSASSVTPAPSSKSRSASSSAKPSVSSSSIAPSSSSSSSSSASVPSRRKTMNVTTNSASDVASNHHRVITRKNVKSSTHRQAKLYRKLTRKHREGIARRYARGTSVRTVIKQGRGARRIVGERHGHGLMARRQLELRKATNAKVQRQRKNTQKLPQTGEVQSYSALYAMLFVLSSVVMAGLGRAIDKRRHD